MVITGNQIKYFFDDGNHMGIENRTRILLQEQGISTVGDLVEFTKEKIWRQVIENCKASFKCGTSWRWGAHNPEKFALKQNC